ncbi:hypothetical protein [Parabacteroides provencensis]|uniref:hypothetical protein n=1 Tax=Parabacteroides provencensis TaxID=1944636 RepID=UPI000C14A119|nr:hypothetical protein [Parabacteroides provencensis]
MVKVKQDRKVTTPAEREEMKRLEEESDRILDLLFENPTDQKLLDKLNQIDVAYVRLSGEKSMEY